MGFSMEGKPSKYSLNKFSSYGNVWEYISLAQDFPAELDEDHIQYHMYYHQ
jgi:hypothetical protein